MTEWYSMEAVPGNIKMHQECILLCNASVSPPMFAVAYWDDDTKSPDHKWHVEDAARGFNYHVGWPTHWTHLPVPPALTAGKREEVS